MSLFRVGNLVELGFNRAPAPHVPLGFTFQDSLRQFQPRNHLGGRVHGRQLRHALIQLNSEAGMVQVSGHAAVCVTGEIKVKIHRCSPLQVANVNTRLAQALHRDQAHHGASPLDAGGVAAGTAVPIAPSANPEVGFLASPFTRQRPHIAGRYGGFGFLPFGAFGDAVLLA